jgi:hypothetical protein
MDKDVQHRHGHAAWTRTCGMDKKRQHIMNMDMQDKHGHAAWTWTGDMGMDMQNQH